MSQPDVTPVRNQFNVKGLEAFLTSKNYDNSLITLGADNSWPLSGMEPPFKVQQFSFGQSNPTYYITDAKNRPFVLRRKPSPNAKLVSKSAHSIEREFFMLKGIEVCNSSSKKKVPVPKVHLLCEDESIIGFVFYLMDFVDGRQLKNPDMPELDDANKKKHWDSILETITAIHSLDTNNLVKELPAKHFPQFQPDRLKKSSSASYFERQVKTLSAVTKGQSQTVDPIPFFQEIANYILEKAPKDPTKPTLIHGDCKIDNFLFDPVDAKVVAVLDWELCTFGHPIFDLANFLQPFQLPNKLNLMLFYPQQTDMGLEIPGSIEGVYEKLHLYEKKLGHKWRDGDLKNNAVDSWTVGYVFGLFRLCVISQGIAMRIKKGSASSGSAEGFAALYPYLAQLAVDYMKNGGENSKL